MTITNPAAILIDTGGNPIGVNGNPLAVQVSGSMSVYTTSAQLISGSVTVAGQVASGSAATAAPVVIAGVDGGNLIRAFSTDFNGKLNVVNHGTTLSGSTANGSAPVMVAGTDILGVVRTLRTDTAGAINVVSSPSATGTTTSIASSITNVTLLVSNTSRKGATIFNDGTKTLSVKLGATASATSFAAQITARGYYEVPFGYTGIIDGIWDVANGSARITELTL